MLHPECAAYKNGLRQEYRNKRKASGTCYECDEPKYKGIYCKAHYEEARRSQTERVERLKAQGTCIRCGKYPTAGTTIHCEMCLIKAISSKHFKTPTRWTELKELYDRQEGRCVYSGLPIHFGVDASIDHKIAKHNGGTDDISNLQWVHYNVNIMKWNTSETEFIEFIRLIYQHRCA